MSRLFFNLRNFETWLFSIIFINLGDGLMIQAKQADFESMNISGWLNAHRYSAFVFGTLIIQGITFGAAVYLAREVPTTNSSSTLNTQQQERVLEQQVIVPESTSPDQSKFTVKGNLANQDTIKPSQLEEGQLEEAKASQDLQVNDLQTQDQLIHNQELADQQANLDRDQQPNDTKIIQYKIESGETLAKIWKKHGASYAGCLKAAKAFEEAGIGLSALRAGDTLELTLTENPTDIVALTYRMRAGKTLTLNGSAKLGYSASLERSKVSENERSASGKIDSSFSVAALDLGVPYPVIDDLVDLFSARVEFRKDFQPGDEFTVIFNEARTSEGELVTVGPIKAASLNVNGRFLVAIRHIGKDGVARYFDEKGQSLDSGFLRYPVAFTRISSVFSDSRLHPVTKVRKPHNGVDFAAKTGTPVRTVGDGRVVYAGYNGGAGYMVKVQHDSKWATAYMHLSKIDSKVKKGTFVSRGQLIGAVGATGMASGPHLHYSLYKNGRYVDPIKTSLPLLALDDHNKISGGYLQTALDTLKSMHKRASTQLALNSEGEQSS